MYQKQWVRVSTFYDITSCLIIVTPVTLALVRILDKNEVKSSVKGKVERDICH